MPSTTITLTHEKRGADLLPWGSLPDDSRGAATALAAVLEGIAGGAIDAQIDAVVGATSASPAWGTVTISSGSGAITATINGVAISVTWATSDTATATALAAAINASTHSLVSGIVSASSSAGVVTVQSVALGKVANSITLAASGTGATASTARLTGGAGQDSARTTYLAPAQTTADGTKPTNSDVIAAFLYFYH